MTSPICSAAKSVGESSAFAAALLVPDEEVHRRVKRRDQRDSKEDKGNGTTRDRDTQVVSNQGNGTSVSVVDDQVLLFKIHGYTNAHTHTNLHTHTHRCFCNMHCFFKPCYHQSSELSPASLSSPPIIDYSKKRVRWDPDLCRIQYFDPLPPLSDDGDDEESSPKSKRTKKGSKRKPGGAWQSFWQTPERLDDDVFPKSMSHVQAIACR